MTWVESKHRPEKWMLHRAGTQCVLCGYFAISVADEKSHDWFEHPDV